MLCKSQLTIVLIGIVWLQLSNGALGITLYFSGQVLHRGLSFVCSHANLETFATQPHFTVKSEYFTTIMYSVLAGFGF